MRELNEVKERATDLYYQHVAPILAIIGNFVAKLLLLISPLYQKCMIYYDTHIRKHRPELLIPCFVSIMICFYGGKYPLMVAAVEVYRICGHESLLKCVMGVQRDLKRIEEETKRERDGAKDSGDEGAERGSLLDDDYNENTPLMSDGEAFKKKALLVVRTLEASHVTEAINSLAVSFFAILAAINVPLALEVTLGSALGDVALRPIRKYALLKVEQYTPPDYRKWVNPGVRYATKTITIFLAWGVLSHLSAVYSAFRGGLLFSRNLLAYLAIMGYVANDADATYLDEAIGLGLAGLGLWFQLSLGFYSPFPLNFFLFPFYLAEQILLWLTH